MRLLKIDPKSGIPVYIQLKEGLKLLILQGVYTPEMRLPTVRQMAVELKVNSNTVARAYSELEREGIISSRQGRGTFVCAMPQVQENDAKLAQLEKLLDIFIKNTLSLGFNKRYVLERLETKLKSDAKEDG